MPTEVVWISDWELQCCGTPFDVGGEVTWYLSPIDPSASTDRDPDDVGDRATSSYDEHHTTGPAPDLVTGRVRSILAVSYAYEEHGRTLVRVAGSARQDPRRRATGWEDIGPAGNDGRRFAGYVVELEVAERQSGPEEG